MHLPRIILGYFFIEQCNDVRTFECKNVIRLIMHDEQKTSTIYYSQLPLYPIFNHHLAPVTSMSLAYQQHPL